MFVVALTLTASASYADDNWPQFRGPTGDGQAPSKDLCVEWSESSHVKWKTAIPGKAWSSPVIWGQQVWVTNATADGKKLSVVCLNKDDGKILFDKLIFEVPTPQFCHAFNSYASSTPVIEQGRIYVHFGSAGTACLSTDTCEVLWSRRDLPCDHFRGPASSPILYGNLLFVDFDGFDFQYVVALDKKTGKNVWKKDRDIDYGNDDGDGKKAYGTCQIIEVNGRPQLVSPAASATIAYEPLTGEMIWKVQHGGMNAALRPLYSHGLLYLNTGAGGDKLLAVRPTGKGDITKSGVAWRYNREVPTRPSYIILGDLLVMISDAGVVSCLEAKTSKLVWQKRLGGNFSASPIVSGNRIYACDQEGTSTVFLAEPEFKSLATNKLEEGCMASPAASGNALFMRTRTHLYRIEE